MERLALALIAHDSKKKDMTCLVKIIRRRKDAY
jgi:methylglyoxal synthase